MFSWIWVGAGETGLGDLLHRNTAYLITHTTSTLSRATQIRTHVARAWKRHFFKPWENFDILLVTSIFMEYDLLYEFSEIKINMSDGIWSCFFVEWDRKICKKYEKNCFVPKKIETFLSYTIFFVKYFISSHSHVTLSWG